MESTTLAEAATEALRLAESAPRRALAPAGQVARRARRQGDAQAGSVAERALGVALLHLRDTTQAARHLRVAATLAGQADAPELLVAARLQLAVVHNLRGRPAEALREIDRALETSTTRTRPEALAQRAALRLQLGRLADAEEDLDLAVPALRAAGDVQWLKRALSNRGIVRARRFRFAAAEADFQESLRLNQDLGIELSVAFVEQNLGWVAGLRGDVPRALTHLDRAEQTLRAHGARVGFVLEDRAVLLLSVGLVREARAAAADAVAALREERQHLAVPDVRLLLARAGLADGDVAAAEGEARAAARALARRGRPEAAALARLLVTQCRAADPAQRSRLATAPLARLAEELEEAGWVAESVGARLLLADLLLERNAADRGSGHLVAAARRRTRGPASVRAAGWYAEAQLRARAGRDRDVLAALSSGLRVLDEQRAGFGSLDLRVHAGSQREGLVALGLRTALARGRLSEVFEWAERGRNTHLLLPPLLPPEDVGLEADLAELRLAVAAVDDSRRSGSDPRPAYRRQTAVERRIRDRTRRVGGVEGTVRPTVRLDALAGTLGGSALVEYVEVDGELHALVVADGRSTLRALGPAATASELVHRLPFALRRAGSADGLLRDAARRLDALLLAPLGLGDQPLVVVPTGVLQSLPWSVLPSCSGRAVTVAPSATSWHTVSLSTRGARGRAVVVAGPGLPGAEEEARAVADLHGTAPLAPSATVADVLTAVGGAGVVHLAAHGTIHDQHPLLSSVLLHDGPLTGYDLERLRPAPDLVVLASCDGGRHAARVGDELLGLTATLLARGTQVVVAPVVPVGDAATVSLMTRFHTRLLAGDSAAEALAGVQAEDGAAAGFVCFGGDYRSPAVV